MHFRHYPVLVSSGICRAIPLTRGEYYSWWRPLAHQVWCYHLIRWELTRTLSTVNELINLLNVSSTSLPTLHSPRRRQEFVCVFVVLQRIPIVDTLLQVAAGGGAPGLGEGLPRGAAPEPPNEMHEFLSTAEAPNKMLTFNYVENIFKGIT